MSNYCFKHVIMVNAQCQSVKSIVSGNCFNTVRKIIQTGQQVTSCMSCTKLILVTKLNQPCQADNSVSSPK